MNRRQIQQARNVPDKIIKDLPRVVSKLAPPGYLINNGWTHNGDYGVSARKNDFSYNNPMREFNSSANSLRAAYVKAIAWARRDARIERLALHMCRTMNMEPYAHGPWPFGPMVFGQMMGNGGMGFVQSAQMPPEIKRMLDWIWPHAAMALAAREFNYGENNAAQ
jgi:hypothetical protein